MAGLKVIEQTSKDGAFTLPRGAPKNVQAVICKRSSIMPAPHDYKVLQAGYTLYITDELSRVAALGIVDGKVRLDMMDGAMTRRWSSRRPAGACTNSRRKFRRPPDQENHSMKGMLAAIALVVATVPPAFGEEALASEASVRELLEITQARKLSEGTVAQMDQFMNEAMNRELAGRVPTAEQQAILDDLRTKLVALIGDALKWEKLEPRYVDIYRKSFTDEEVAGMLAFYKTPAGQAVINKMPIVMQHTMGLVQDLLQDISPQLRQIQTTEAMEKLKQSASAPPPPGG